MFGGMTLARTARLPVAFVAGLLVSTALAGVMPVQGFAQGTTQSREISFNIPAQPLADALIQFGRQAGLQVSADQAMTANLRSTAVNGAMAPQQALNQILSGSGLGYRITGNMVSLERVSGAGSTVLPPISVEGRNAPGETAWGPVAGYHAKRTGTATRTDTALRDVPQSVTVVSRQAMEDRASVSVADALELDSSVQRGVNSQSAKFTDRSLTVRGFPISNCFSDGLRDPRNCASISYDMANVERIEVLKGPASIMFGQSDPGGSVNVVTRQPQAETFLHGDVSYGSYDYGRMELDANTVLSNKAQFRLNTAYQSRESFVDHVDSARYILAPSLAVDISDRTRAIVQAEYQSLYDIYYTGLPAAGTVLPNANGKLPIERFLGDAALEGDSDGERSIGKVGTKISHELNDSVTLRSALRYTHFMRDERDVILGSLGTDQRTMSRSFFASNGTADDYYATVDLNWKGHALVGHDVVVGTDYWRSIQNPDKSYSVSIASIDIFNPVYGNIAEPAVPAERRIFESQLNNYGFFAQDLISLTDSVKMLVGLRYDRVEQRSVNKPLNSTVRTTTLADDYAYSPRAGLIWQPTDMLSLYASYTESFRPITGATFAGKAFEPEAGRQYEAGVKTEWLNGAVGANVAVFDILRENLTTTDPVNSGYSIQIGEQHSRGLEVDLTGQLTPELRAIASYTFVDAEVTRDTSGAQGRTPPNVAKHAARLWLVHEWQQGSLRGYGLGLGAVLTDDRPANTTNTAYLPGFARFDALAYIPITDAVRFQLNVINLFNTEYYETSTFNSINNGISPGAPLTVIGRVGVRF